jgi:hypothetical protein
MFERLKNLIKRQPTPVQATPRQQQESLDSQRPNIFNLPPDCTPIDGVLNTVKIPGTNIEIGTIARAIERNGQERIGFEQLRGFRAGCNHPIFSIDQLGGTCFCCEFESLQLLSQNLITQSQAEERSLFCIQCASYCMGCFRQICAAHTRLFQCPDGRFVPLCPACEQATHKSLLGKLISLITGK